MNTQPEALRLAEELEDRSEGPIYLMSEAAAELRRLHEVNQMMVAALHKAENQILALAPEGYIPPALGAIHAALAEAKEQA